jgi:hypothetical protein
LKYLNGYLLAAGQDGKTEGLRPARFPCGNFRGSAQRERASAPHMCFLGKKRRGNRQGFLLLSDFVYPTLVLLLLLQAKHVLADFILTSDFIIQNRWIYGHPGGLLHVALHVAGSFLAFLIAGLPGLGALLFLLIAEALIHYHIDWTKDNLTRRYALTPKDAKFWWAMGIDQFLHQATYLGMAAYWAAIVLA